MTSIIVTLSLISLACRGFANRELIHMLSCPGNVALNPRRDCIDNKTQAIMPRHCCKELQWCMEKISGYEKKYSKQIEAIYERCGLLSKDVVIESGEFVIVHNERICVPACQNMLPKYQPIDQPIKSKCAVHYNLKKLQDQASFINVLASSWSYCTTTTTTTTTTVTTNDFFDFTDYFMIYGTEKWGTEKWSYMIKISAEQPVVGGSAKFPDGQDYHCCCRPDGNRRSVDCKLVPSNIESLTDGLRMLIWSGCGGKLGGDYHSYNKVFHTTWHNYPRTEFEGLANLGKCIVWGEELPEPLFAYPQFLRDYGR